MQYSLFFSFVRDVAAKLRASFWILLSLSCLQAFSDGLRVTISFLLFPFIGIPLNGGKLLPYVQQVFSWARVPYNFVSVSILVGFVFLLHSIIIILVGWFHSSCAQLYSFRWRKDLIHALGIAKWQYYVETPQGTLFNALSQQTVGLELAVRKLVATFGGFLIAFTYVWVAFWMLPIATIVLLALGSLLLLLNKIIVKRVIVSSRTAVGQSMGLMVLAGEFFSNIKILKASAGFANIEKFFAHQLSEIMRHARWAGFLPAVSRGISELFLICLILMALVVIRHLDQQLASGTIVALFVLFLRAFGKISSALSSYQQGMVNLASYEYVNGVFDLTRKAEEPIDINSQSWCSESITNSINYDSVTVCLNGEEVLTDVNVRFSVGEITALVGPSGAGKTTLVDTLLRLADITHGRIMVDGHNLLDIDLISWRSSIGYVAQHTTLFNGTVRDNIRWFLPDASEAEVINAAKLAHAHEFIVRMEHKYDTLVGEQGMRISGGQRQRLALARALLNDPQILILDEATSALDSNLEEQVLEAVYGQRGERIVILVAHRLSTVRDADQIYVLDAGRVVEHGNWEELTRGNGLFNKLYRKQNVDR